MAKSNIEENAFQIIRFMVENGGKVYTWGDIRKELALSPDDFTTAYHYLKGRDCCHTAGRYGDEAQILIDNAGYSFYSAAKAQRYELSRDAEILLKCLVKDQTPDWQYSLGEKIMSDLGWGEEQYMDAAQELSDNAFVKGDTAADNPFWTISLLPAGRMIVRAGFKQTGMFSGVIHTGDINTNIHGNNNLLTIGSILTSANQSVEATSTLDESEKETLQNMLDQLQQHLQEVPDDFADDAEAVAEMARSFVEGATKEKRNKKLLKITAEGLKKAAENIASIAPNVLNTVLAIIVFVDKLS